MNKFLAILCLVFLGFAVPSIAAPPVPKDGLKMAKTPKVTIFNHSTHSTISCESCHHPVNGTPSYLPCSASGCHDVMGNQAKGVDSYFQAMHKRAGVKYDTCVSCHVKIAGNDPEKKKALTTCKSCHA